KVVAEVGVCVDVLLVLLALERVLVLPDVELELLGVLFEIGVLELLLVVEELVVGGPEASFAFLGARLEAQRRGWDRACVERKRLVLPHEAHLVLVGFLYLLERLLDPLAVRALEVGKLDDRDGGGRRTPRRAAADGDSEDGLRVFLLALFFLFFRRGRVL